MNQLSIRPLLWMLLLLLPVSLPAQILQWSYEPIVNDVQDAAANPDLIQDAAGNFHLVIWNPVADRLEYGFQDAATRAWTWEVVAPGLGPHGFRSAMTLDDQGGVHIAFHAQVLDHAQLRYATNASGNWMVESPLEAENIGPYGVDPDATRASQGSLDIELLASGQPFITCFDGSVDGVGFCPDANAFFYNAYDLELLLAEKNSNGWVQQTMPDLTYLNQGSSCLQDGDRFGEFCQIIPRESGEYWVLTNSFHNHYLVLLQSQVQDLSTWNVLRLDSVRSWLPGINTRFFETFEYMDAQVFEDSLLNISFTVAGLYGFLLQPNRNSHGYVRFRMDSLAAGTVIGERKVSFPPGGVYRTYSNLATRHPDSLFVVSAGAIQGQVLLNYSFTGGIFWLTDTLADVSTNAKIQSELRSDTLHVFVYDLARGSIVEIARHINTGGSRTRYLRRNEVRGRLLASEVARNGGQDLVELVYPEDFSGSLRFASRTGGNWTFETVTSNVANLKGLAMTNAANGEPELIYSTENPDRLRFAQRVNGTWQIQNIAALELQNLTLVQGSDSTYGAGYQPSEGALYWLSRPTGGSNWQVRRLDSSDGPTGQTPALRIRNDSLWLAYRSVGSNRVLFASRFPDQAWQFEAITEPFNYNPQDLDLQISASGEPVLIFKDANSNRIQLVTRDSTAWNIEQIFGDPGNLTGVPLQLILDSKGRPWILYNFPDIQNELRLLRKDAVGNWQAVSVLNNQNQIANVFEFHLVGDDFYIIGQQQEPGQRGLGLLFAENGVRTLLDPAQPLPLPLTLAPNPTKSQTRLMVHLPTADQVTWELYNLQGQSLHIEQSWRSAGAQEFDLPTAHLMPGLYFVRLRQGNYQGQVQLIRLPD